MKFILPTLMNGISTHPYGTYASRADRVPSKVLTKTRGLYIYNNNNKTLWVTILLITMTFKYGLPFLC
jgi:hypothetical protein